MIAMSELETLQAQKRALLKAMRSGALSVQHGDKRVQYRTIAEMKAVLSDLNEEIEAETGTRRKRVFYLDIRRGY